MWDELTNEQNNNLYESGNTWLNNDWANDEINTFTNIVLANGYLRAANSFAKAFIKLANNNKTRR